jgi:hypothetical protein
MDSHRAATVAQEQEVQLIRKTRRIMVDVCIEELVNRIIGSLLINSARLPMDDEKLIDMVACGTPCKHQLTTWSNNS